MLFRGDLKYCSNLSLSQLKMNSNILKTNVTPSMKPSVVPGVAPLPRIMLKDTQSLHGTSV